MNQEIEKLIAIALIDGTLTDKEKEIILRKAEKLGEDVDEVEMIIEGKMYELQSAVHQEPVIQPVISNERSDISIKKLLDNLQEIDYEITNPPDKRTTGDRVESTISGTLKTIFDKTNVVEQGVDAFKSVFGGTTSKDRERMIERENEMERISLLYGRKASIINLFPLPDNKNELLELANISYTNFKSLKNEYDDEGIMEGEYKMMNAWKNKVEQIITKMEANFSDDTFVTKQIIELQKKMEKFKEKKKKSGWWD